MVRRNPGFSVPLYLRNLSGGEKVWYVGTLGLLYAPLGLRILAVLCGGGGNRGTCVFASRMVLWLFVESYGTLAAVSVPLVMPLHDPDIPMNVPITFRNKQPVPKTVWTTRKHESQFTCVDI